MHNLSDREFIEVGDIVELTDGRGYLADVLEVNWVNDSYRIKFKNVDLIPNVMYYEKKYLRLYRKGDLVKAMCECGAAHTSAPTLHMFYCPEFKEIK
jgi:hypothetical protein